MSPINHGQKSFTWHIINKLSNMQTEKKFLKLQKCQVTIIIHPVDWQQISQHEHYRPGGNKMAYSKIKEYYTQ